MCWAGAASRLISLSRWETRERQGRENVKFQEAKEEEEEVAEEEKEEMGLQLEERETLGVCLEQGRGGRR